MSSITFTNGVINLEDLQYEMNRNVKNYMMDTPNWSVATSNLKYLLSQTASFFMIILEVERDLPLTNTGLFLQLYPPNYV